MVRLVGGAPTPQDIAFDYRSRGMHVFPAKYKDKFTLVKWEPFQQEPAEEKLLRKWFRNGAQVNYWLMTGVMSGIIVVDADSEDGDRWWRDRYGDELFDNTTKVKASKGFHYYFKIPEGFEGEIKSWAVHPKQEDDHEIAFDFSADGRGVIAPPSIHPTGAIYTLVNSWDDMAEAPPGMLDGTDYEERPKVKNEGDVIGTGGQVRSMLTSLLESPPDGEGSGRNDWLARVAGHYAKAFRDSQDLYLVQCKMANRSMGEPLDDAEFTKTVESIWKGEHERNQHRSVTAACGYLMSGGTTIQCQIKERTEEGIGFGFVEYADFDMKAKGVMEDEAGRRTYWVEIIRASRVNQGKIDKIEAVIKADVLGDDRGLRKFLANYACTIVPPDAMYPKTGTPGVRLQRYLESQAPPVVSIVPALGWYPDAVADGVSGFVTHDGAITADGFLPTNKIAMRSDPRLKAGGMAPFEYGFKDDELEAQNVLTEVLTFHDEAITSVFGSWWAACLLKPQIEDRTSLFPFIGLEAPSESGKTNGFFSMMHQLNGSTRGETQPTKAALRDMAAAHQSGIAWIDDLDDPAYLMELLRAATSRGSLTKMGEDRESVKNTTIVSPVIISGEALGLGTQKALVDRAIAIKAPSPTGRRSIHNPDVPQWDDIISLRERYPDGLHVLAGWYVQRSLHVVDEVLAALRAGRTGGSGRASDKVAVLRAGARLLDYLTGHDDPWAGTGLHARRVEKWLKGNLVDSNGVALSSQENALTLEVLPWALRKYKFPAKAEAGQGDEPDTPVFIKGYDPENEESLFGAAVTLHFNAALLSEAWRREHHGRVEKRTTTEEAFRDQAGALGWKSRRTRINNGGGRLSYYFEGSGEIAQSVIRRAIGG